MKTDTPCPACGKPFPWWRLSMSLSFTFTCGHCRARLAIRGVEPRRTMRHTILLVVPPAALLGFFMAARDIPLPSAGAAVLPVLAILAVLEIASDLWAVNRGMVVAPGPGQGSGKEEGEHEA